MSNVQTLFHFTFISALFQLCGRSLLVFEIEHAGCAHKPSSRPPWYESSITDFKGAVRIIINSRRRA